MTDDEQPSLPEIPARWSASDVLGVINVFERMLLAMESRLVAKMDDNSRSASERWASHDLTLAANEKKIITRFERLEGDLIKMEEVLNGHLRKEEHEDLVNEARIRPIKGSLAWFWRNWRDILLLFIGLVAAGTFFLDWVTHLTNIVPS
jgi:hypothetical protein